MSAFENLKVLLKMFADFDEQEIQSITSCFKENSANKTSILVHEGQICKTFYFVVSGCLRIYFIDANGHEKTRYIMPSNHIGTALASFCSQTPSTEFVEAVTDTSFLSISHSDFYRLNREMDHWKLFYQRILEMAYSFQNRRIEQFVTLDAMQRYELFMKENPGLNQLLSNRILASYLDIREETLSRLKSR